MKPTISIIISSFQRSHLLKWNLFSLSKQDIPYPFETIVLNDGIHDETESICKKYEQKLNLQYIFTGQRNNNDIVWRVPGFAFNIGAKASSGDILILCDAEMFHVNDTIPLLSLPVLSDDCLLAIPTGIDDCDGSFLNLLENDYSYNITTLWNNYPRLNTSNPFLMAVSRRHFFSIGGYDEDFTGIAFDDSDLTLRLSRHGCRYHTTNAKAIHLYHKRKLYGKNAAARKSHNFKLYQERRAQLVRNQDKQWGTLPKN